MQIWGENLTGNRSALIGRLGGILKSQGLRTLLKAKRNTKALPDNVAERVQVSWLKKVKKGEFSVKQIKTRVITEANPSWVIIYSTDAIRLFETSKYSQIRKA